jgi:hypothetical protein
MIKNNKIIILIVYNLIYNTYKSENYRLINKNKVIYVIIRLL